MFGTCQFPPGALTRNLACDKVKVTPVTVLEGKAGSRKMRTVKPGQGPSLSHISLQYVNFGVFLRFSDAIENILNPFTYYFHAVRISDAVRSPLSQARAGGGGGDAHGKALVPVRTSVSRDGGGGCRRRSGDAQRCLLRLQQRWFALCCQVSWQASVSEAGAGSNPSAELEPFQLLVTLLFI